MARTPDLVSMWSSAVVDCDTPSGTVRLLCRTILAVNCALRFRHVIVNALTETLVESNRFHFGDHVCLYRKIWEKFQENDRVLLTFSWKFSHFFFLLIGWACYFHREISHADSTFIGNVVRGRQLFSQNCRNVAFVKAKIRPQIHQAKWWINRLTAIIFSFPTIVPTANGRIDGFISR